jgi:PelA/Pel-15E family pectate lyase
MLKKVKYKPLLLFLIVLLTINVAAQDVAKTDPVAENMLLYQRSVGGWPKAVGNVKVDYTKVLSEGERMATVEDASRNDATIDNGATYKEITYLVKAYQQYGNKAYLQAAEKGIQYLLKAQDANGGWPQYYPDSSLYRSEITFNDDAMMHVMHIMDDVAKKENGFEVVDASLSQPAAKAVNRGVACILKTQVKVNGKLTAWCQQYDKNTLQPAMARKFELVSITPDESVGIVEFLMNIKDPSAEVKNAVKSAVEWFNLVKIKGYRFDHIKDARQSSGRDAVVVPDENSTIWARFYEIGTNKPFFAGRNSVKKYNLAEIENERRAGYAWYGTWPQKLLNGNYAIWAKKHGITNKI